MRGASYTEISKYYIQQPENTLIDIDGHIKVADFGLSKLDYNENSLNYTFCGAPEYMCPEILLHQQYNHTVDYYSIGALYYELLTGKPMTRVCRLIIEKTSLKCIMQ